MFVLYANKNRLTTRKVEPVTSGSVNVYDVHFEFSPDWQGMTRTAVFRSTGNPVSVLLDEDNRCTIPWYVLTTQNRDLSVGVYGTIGDDVVLPTIWASLGPILEGAAPGDDARPPTPELWQQELAKKGDTLSYDGLNLTLKSGDKPLSSVEITNGGGEGGPVYKFGHGLKQEGLTVSVDAVNDFTGDNTLPITAAGVQTTVGNIEALLATI